MEEWDAALKRYSDKEITRHELKPHWLKETERLMGFEIEADKIHQADPLFEHAWSPSSAAQHLTIVWQLKGWLKPMAA